MLCCVRQAEIEAAGVSGAAEGAAGGGEPADSDDDMHDHYDAGHSPQHRSLSYLTRGELKPRLHCYFFLVDGK